MSEHELQKHRCLGNRPILVDRNTGSVGILTVFDRWLTIVDLAIGRDDGEVLVDTSGLVERFRENADAAFFEVLRTSGEALTAQQVKRPLLAAGAPKAEVDRTWKQLQRQLHRSPHIVKGDRTYRWVVQKLAPSEALKRLAAAARNGPEFVRQDYVETISDALANIEPGSGAEMTWTEQKRFERAKLAAELASGSEAIAADGGTGREVAAWLLTQLQRQRVRVTARLGDKLPFDPDRFDVTDGGRPPLGTEVDVVRTGFEYVGDDVHTLIRAQVRGR